MLNSNENLQFATCYSWGIISQFRAYHFIPYSRIKRKKWLHISILQNSQIDGVKKVEGAGGLRGKHAWKTNLVRYFGKIANRVESKRQPFKNYKYIILDCFEGVKRGCGNWVRSWNCCAKLLGTVSNGIFNRKLSLRNFERGKRLTHS